MLWLQVCNYADATVRMHASFVTLYTIYKVSPWGCGSSVKCFPVMYMNTFKQQLCYNDNNVTTTLRIKGGP